MDVLSIPEYYRGKEVLITGGTGFLGKVIIEKLLRSCPNVKKIYLLIRGKRGQTVEERLRKLLEDELFSLLKAVKPDSFKKLAAVSGDVSELKLGMSEEDRALVRGVHVVFHVAASVRFDDPLTKATLMNTRGTREVMELMLEMSCLEVGVHVSTTYCNTDKDIIEERVYQDHGDWKEAIKISEEYEDDHKVVCLTEKCQKQLKNTYLLTKHWAENVVEDYRDRLPLVIYRPGVVVSMWKDPLPGWVDNMNGPIGLMLGIGKGVIRTLNTNPNSIVDNIPVDVVVKGIIISAWKKGIKASTEEKLPVYNCTIRGNYDVTQKETTDISMAMLEETPFNGSLWYPLCDFTMNKYLFYIKFMIFNVLPAIFVDTILKISGRHPMLLKIVRKAYIAMQAISYFMQRNWVFKSDKNWSLNEILKPDDRVNFDFSVEGADLREYMMYGRLGASKYLLKEKIDMPLALRALKRQKILHFTIKYTFYGAVLYTIFRRYCQVYWLGVVKSEHCEERNTLQNIIV